MSRVLVVDDEKLIVKGIRFSLEQDGMEVDCAYDGEEAVQLAKEKQYDIILLDLMLPKLSGLEVCQQVREFSSVPIVMLTAKGEDMDKILGLEYGADDYITKPFSLKELCTRVKALIRRKEYCSPKDSNNDIITCGDISVNLARRTVMKKGKAIDLTMKEFDLMTSLMLSKSRVLNRDQLMEKVWDVEFCGDARTVDVHIRYLRQKIEDESENPKYILTVRGVGYRFASEEEI